MLRGIRLGEYVEGNIFHCFAIVISYSFSPALPFYNQSRTQLFRQLVIGGVYVI